METSDGMDAETIRARLASALGRRDQQPNIDLAQDLCKRADTVGIDHVCTLLRTGASGVKGDAIKILCEIGARDPDLIAPHADLFLRIVKGKNNRLVWGAMTALAGISKTDATTVFENLDGILEAADRGSVIAKDQAIEILINLKKNKSFSEMVTPILLDRLRSAAATQFPMYAERIFGAVDKEDSAEFHEILSSRLKDGMPASKRKRIEKLLARL